jgi:hypothetical protein
VDLPFARFELVSLVHGQAAGTAAEAVALWSVFASVAVLGMGFEFEKKYVRICFFSRIFKN